MADTSKPSLWLQLYFVLASLIGLIMLVVGGSGLINIVLTNTLLKTNSGRYQSPPPQPYTSAQIGVNEEKLSAEDKESLEQWRQDYKTWQEIDAKRDYAVESRNQSLAWAIAMILTGAPVFLLHAPFVFRQARH